MKINKNIKIVLILMVLALVFGTLIYFNIPKPSVVVNELKPITLPGVVRP